MLHSGTNRFISYWQGLQPGAELAPERARFDPAALKPLVPQMVMISATEKGLPFRLGGALASTLHGQSLKGMPFLSLFREPFHIPLLAGLRQSLRTAQPLVLNVESEWHSPGDTPEAETVNLEITLCPLMATPKGSANGRVDRFVGLYQTVSAQPRAGLGQLGALRLSSSLLIEPRLAVRPGHLHLISLEGRRMA